MSVLCVTTYKEEFHESIQRYADSLVIENNRTFENPKRKQRAARKQMQKTGIGTKSQQALQLQLEARKVELKNFNKVQQAVLKQHQFELKKQKHKEKHRGH